MTLEHQAARRKAPVAGVTTQGMVTASRGDARKGRSGSSAAKSYRLTSLLVGP